MGIKVRSLNIHRQFLIRLLGLTILIVSTLSAYMAHGIFENRQADTFASSSQEKIKILQGRLLTYTDSLYATRSYLAASADMSQTKWDNYVTGMSVFTKYPGLSSIVYLPRVDSARQQEFENYAKKASGDMNYKIVGSPRPQYAPVIFYSSINDIRSVLGKDIQQLKDRESVMKSAESSFLPRVTPPIHLASNNELGFTMILPTTAKTLDFTDGTIKGFVLLAIRVNDFINELFPIRDTAALEWFSITDVSSKPSLLYQSVSKPPASSRFNKSYLIDVGGRTWNVAFHSNRNNSINIYEQTLPILIALQGIAAFMVCLVLSLQKKKL